MKKTNILVVDDDPSIRQLYTDALSLAGFGVIAAKDGTEGVQLAFEKHPDLILVDLLMPGLDGHETVKKIREDAWGRDAKVIFLTNLSEPKDVFHAVELKPEEYIVKSHAEIKDVVNQVRIAVNA